MKTQTRLINNLLTTTEQSIRKTLKKSHGYDAKFVRIDSTKPLKGFASDDNKTWYPFEIDGDDVTFGV